MIQFNMYKCHIKKVIFSLTSKKTYLFYENAGLLCCVVAVTQKMGFKIRKGKVRRIEMPQDAAMTDLSNVP